MKIGIVGSCGVVGRACSIGFARLGHVIMEHDLRLGTDIDAVCDTDVVYVCVPTPAGADWACDTSIVEGVVAELAERNYRGIVAVKSTVSPGTTDRLTRNYGGLRICCVPEFLRAKTAAADFFECRMLIVGTLDPQVCAKVRKSYNLPFLCWAWRHVKPIEAELAKLCHNAFNALRVVWANEVFDVCSKVGADYGKVKDCMVASTGIPDQYLDCTPEKRAFGGTCLPKDTVALLSFARGVASDFSLLEATVAKNNKLTSCE